MKHSYEYPLNHPYFKNRKKNITNITEGPTCFSLIVAPKFYVYHFKVFLEIFAIYCLL